MLPRKGLAPKEFMSFQIDLNLVELRGMIQIVLYKYYSGWW
jgi:hypothetical protein